METKPNPVARVIRYARPEAWIAYDMGQVAQALVDAKSAVLSLRSVPFQRSWVEKLQQMEFKREIAGTSRIEGADFTERELEVALRDTPEGLLTRSQRQAHAAVRTYRWIALVPDDRPIDGDLIREIHRRVVTGADDDHCPPGQLRKRDDNVTFGQPRHRGVEGGEDCENAFTRLVTAIQSEYRGHDPLIQALAAHYHLAAMHPFSDGNGRTARALEALLLQRAGLRDTCFIAMSNYYYEEKPSYLATLSQVRAQDHDLTSFLLLGLRGVAIQAGRLLDEIQHHIARELFRNLMYDLFKRLKSPRRRVIAERQMRVLRLLLDRDWVDLAEITRRTSASYASLKNPRKALVRDLNDLIRLRAAKFEKTGDGGVKLAVRLEWPTEITETDFLERIRALPMAKTHSFLE